MSVLSTLHPTAIQDCQPSVANLCPRVDGQSYKALLIGVRATEPASDEYPRLNGPHKDVESVKALLIDCYGYRAPDITILIDDGIAGHVQPTRANILQAIGDLVKDTKAGDHLSFHYSGHSMQIPNHHSSEEHGKDECLVPCDGIDNRITDNELNAALVLPLPAGCQLVALLDTCHSGSLLNLKHYRCNRVFVPWKYPGKRGSDDIRRVVRNNARLVSPFSSILSGRKSIPPSPTPYRLLARPNEINMNPMCQPPHASGPLDAQRPPCIPRRRTAGHPTSGSRPGAKPQRTFTYLARTVSFAPSSKDHGPALEEDESGDLALPGKSWLPEEDAHPRCESPVPVFPCTGWCRDPDKAAVEAEPSAGGVRADVISLASCKDSQVTFENEDGSGMTSSLVEILRRKPNQPLKDVLLLISHAMYARAMIRHGNAKKYRMRFKAYRNRVLRDRTALFENHIVENHRTMSLVSDIPDISEFPPSPLSSVPTFPPPTTSFFAKKINELKKRPLKHIVIEQSRIPERARVDLDTFQNPQLSSAKPLNLELPFRF
ncbi:caspase domain-containing protein [Mycena galopus ATCC 62051]|nr:caspase domain-containing protein [Mycena galopus ATCC 62051]